MDEHIFLECSVLGSVKLNHFKKIPPGSVSKGTTFSNVARTRLENLRVVLCVFFGQDEQ